MPKFRKKPVTIEAMQFTQETVGAATEPGPLIEFANVGNLSDGRPQIHVRSLEVVNALVREDGGEFEAAGLLQDDAEVLRRDALKLVNDNVRLPPFGSRTSALSVDCRRHQ